MEPLATPPPPQPPPPSSGIPTAVLVVLGLFILLPILIFFIVMTAVMGFGGGWGHMGPDVDFPLFFPFFWFGFAALYWLLAAGLGVWAYRDAEARNMVGILWGLVVFFAPIIGLVVYLVVRESPPRGLLKHPPPLAPGAAPSAPFWATGPPPGAPQEAQPPRAAGFCPGCGARAPPGARFCPHCGTRLG